MLRPAGGALSEWPDLNDVQHSQVSYARLGWLVAVIRSPAVHLCASKQRQSVLVVAGIGRKPEELMQLASRAGERWLFGCTRLLSEEDLLLHSLTGIPSILALMSFLLLLMAERTASRRNPGHLSSFRISLQTHWVAFRKQSLRPNVHQHLFSSLAPTSGNSWAPPAPGTGWFWVRSSRRWCHAPPSWWNTAGRDPCGRQAARSATRRLCHVGWTGGERERAGCTGLR